MTDPAERILPASAIALGLLVAGIAVALVLGEPEPTPPATPELTAKPEVKLVVLVVFDQLRADLIDRPEWREHFGTGGFRRLQTDGAWFTRCHYPYAVTATGPGHAAMLTGAPPAVTGIVNNEWYDRGTKAEAYCAGDIRYRIVPEKATAEPANAKPKQAGAPTRLLAPTVADVLKASTGHRGKVFGVSLKDRSSILPSGSGKDTKPDGVFWFDGRFVTSTYYADAVPGWVAEFNTSGKAESYFGKDWVRKIPGVEGEKLYDTLAGPDNGEGEGNLYGQGVTFPHPMTGGKDKAGQPFADVKAAGSSYYSALANSPMGNELLVEFAKKCIDAEHLGADDVPDLLTVSFSSNDLIGHTWGPDSHEVLDSTLRSDDILAGLLKHLDEKVGQGKYAVVLTADHGICPLPEFAAKHTKRYPQAEAARRVPSKIMREGAEAHLTAKFGQPGEEKTRWIEEVKPPYFYLNHAVIKAKGQTPDVVADELAAWLKTQSGVAGAFTAGSLRARSDDPVTQKVQLAFLQDRSGDVYVVLDPYLLIGEPDKDNKVPTGTTHGAPHAYDTHVPLLVYGPGVKGGERKEDVTPLHAAPVAAKFLGVPPPAKAVYGVPRTLAE